MTHGDTTLDRINAFLDDDSASASGDALLGRRALARKLITPEALCFCLEQQAAGRRAGDNVLLGQIMVRRGLITEADLEKLLKDGKLLLPGLQRYELLATLGEGATAVVHRAWDHELRRTVAVKVLRQDLAKHEQFRKRFHREARVAAGLNHPNLIAVYDAGEADGRLYLVMQVVDGRPLSDLLPELRKDRPALLRLIAKAARGVGVAHLQEIVHRDLKPANILVTHEGEPKVGDFGLAHWEQDEAALTQTGAALGTPLYMAPEQVRGHGITPRTDVYAFGAILYEAMTGRPPHTGGSIAEIYARISNDDPAPCRKAGAEVPADVETIIFKALEKNPGARYANADELADDIERYLRAEPIRARRYSVTQRFGRAVWRRRVPIASAGLALLAAFAGYTIVSRITRSGRLGEFVRRGAEFERAGKLEDARDAWRSAIDLAPGHAEAAAGIERIERSLQKRQAAERIFDQASYSLERASRLLYQADTEAVELFKQADAALELVAKGLADRPDSARGRFLRGRALELRGYPEEAEAEWRDAIRLDPGFAPARLELGRILLERASMADAVVTLERGARFGPRERAAKLADEALREFEAAAAAGRGLDDALRRTVAEAQIEYARNNKAEALRLVEAGIKKHGQATGVEDLHWLHGNMLKDSEAITALTRALEIRPKHPMVLFSRALAHDALGDVRATIGDYSEALRIRPRFFAARLNRGAVLAMQQRYKEAIEDFTVALEIEPRYAPALVNRAICWQSLQNWSASLEDTTTALASDPQIGQARYRRALALANLGNKQEAFTECREAIRTEPDQLDAHILLATLHSGRGDHQQAIEVCREVIRKSADHFEAHRILTDAYIELRDPNGAIAGLTDLMRLRPEDHRYPLKRAQLWAINQQPERALADYATALRLAPQDAELRAAIEREMDTLRK